MADYVYDILILYAISIVIGFIWFSIHFYWKNEEKKCRELSQLAQEWMTTSKIAGYSFLFLPIFIIPFIWLFEKIGGFLGIIVLIGAPGALISMMVKKKK